jgi:hypothetical protein
LLEPSFRIEVQQNEELRRTQQQLYTDIAIKQAGAKSLMSNPALWDRLPDFYKADIIAGAYGIREPNIAAGMVTPHRLSGQLTLGKDLPAGTIIAGTEGNPEYPERNRLYTTNYIPASPFPYQAIAATTQDVLRPIGGGKIGRFDKYTGQFRGVMEGAVQVAWDRPMRYALANGGVGVISMKELAEGKQPTPLPGGVTPAMLATQRLEYRTVVGADENGDPHTFEIPVHVYSQKVPPSTESLLFGTGQPAAAGVPPEATPPAPKAKPTPGVPTPGVGAAPTQPSMQVQGLQGRLPPGTISIPRPGTAITQRMRETAPAVEQLADRILGQLNNEEFLGPLRSRWRKFWAGEVGTEDPDFTFLQTNVDFLQTLLARMHTGAQSEYILRRFTAMIDAGKQDPGNLKAALSAILMYANDIRGMSSQVGRPRAGAQTPAPPGGTLIPSPSLGGGTLIPPPGAAAGANVMSADEFRRRFPDSMQVRLQRSMKIAGQDRTAGEIFLIRRKDFNPDVFTEVR